VVTLRQAYFLHRLADDPRLNIPKIDDENLLIFQKTKKKYHRWEQEVMQLGRTIDAQEISKKQNQFILACSFYDLGELVEIKPSAGSCYVLSQADKLAGTLRAATVPRSCFRAHNASSLKRRVKNNEP